MTISHPSLNLYLRPFVFDHLHPQVYHKEVFPVFRWSEEHSPAEVFGAAGRSGTLYSKAARLRQARYPNVRTLREVSASTRKIKAN
jgi:hypothetical protein